MKTIESLRKEYLDKQAELTECREKVWQEIVKTLNQIILQSTDPWLKFLVELMLLPYEKNKIWINFVEKEENWTEKLSITKEITLHTVPAMQIPTLLEYDLKKILGGEMGTSDPLKLIYYPFQNMLIISYTYDYEDTHGFLSAKINLENPENTLPFESRIVTAVGSYNDGMHHTSPDVPVKNPKKVVEWIAAQIKTL